MAGEKRSYLAEPAQVSTTIQTAFCQSEVELHIYCLNPVKSCSTSLQRKKKVHRIDEPLPSLKKVSASGLTHGSKSYRAKFQQRSLLPTWKAVMALMVLQVRSVTGTNCKSYSKHVLLYFFSPLLLANSPFIHSVQYILSVKIVPIAFSLMALLLGPCKKIFLFQPLDF